MNAPLQTVEAKNVANQALVTLDPETYATAVYEPFKARLETAIENAEGVSYEIKTKEGMALAKEYRATLRAIRIDADKERAARKAPITAIGKLLESKYMEIESAVAPHEDKFNADIKAEEQRLEDEKAAKIKAEEEAKAAIQNRIDAIKNKPIEVMNKSATDVEEAIAELSPLIPTPELYGERFIEAEYALKAALETLNSILSGKKAQAQLDAQNKAATEVAEAEAKELARVSSIKEKIQAIKNYIIKASECDFSSELFSLAEELDNSAILESDFQEFIDEAKATLNKTLQVLHRQHAVMFNAEQAEDAAKKLKQQDAIKPAIQAAAPAVSTLSPIQKEQVNEVLIENQDALSLFLRARDFGKDTNKIRAILVEFIKFKEELDLRKAA